MSDTPPRNPLQALDELLRSPETAVERGGRSFPRSLLLGALLCLALYGAVAGTFQGGLQILTAAWKVPLVLLVAVLLCWPSFYVFVTLAGASASPRKLTADLVGFLGVVSLLLAALLPVAWLFSASTLYLGSIGFLHLAAFLVALGFGYHFLGRCLPVGHGRSAIAPWVILLFLVTAQLASQLRPVLFRPSGMAIVAPEREFFLQQWLKSVDRGPVHGPRSTSSE